jgi:nucleoside-triphosphatase THEP1
MSRVQRDSVAGRAYLDVQNLARRTRRPTAELLHAYALEGFLARLTCSPEAGSLVLKGGVLLAAFAARPTRDIDLVVLERGKVVINEIARMELACPAFPALVEEALAAPVPVVATVHARPHPFTDGLRRRSAGWWP